MKIELCILLVATMGAAGCQPTEPNQIKTPDEVYRAFYENVKNGSVLDDDLRTFSSIEKNEKDDEILDRADANEEFKNSISDAFRRAQLIAQCGELALASEVIDGQKASLVYDRTETCNGDQTIESGVKVELVFEDGWKIDRISATIPEHVLQ